MKASKKFWRSSLLFMLIAALCGGLAIPFLKPVQAAPHLIYPANNIVISEFRTQGPNGGNDEFIELYNPTSGVIDISGWTINGSNATGTTGIRATIPATSPLQPGQYYLVANTATNGYSGSVTPNHTYGTGITNDGGIALVNGATIVDQVGMSAGSAYGEGTRLGTFTSTTGSYERRIGGSNGSCQDDVNNLTDFMLITPSDPQNSSSVVVTCGVPTNTPVPTIDVIINEVAWAGTRAFVGDEWIELYNAGTATADLTNWRIEAADGDPIISLNGLTIGPNGYLLLERGSQNVTNVSGTVYSAGLLSDTGETLYLLNNTSAIVSTANSNGGAWPAGSGSPNFPTMERNGNVPDSDSVWLTFAGTPSALDAGANPIYGTPGAANWALGQVPTPSPTVTLTPSQTLTSSPTNTPSPTNTFTPTNTVTPAGFLSLVINEVAWAGTAASTSDEWIELYNPGSNIVNLSGWRLVASDGTPSINLIGNILPGSYFLLERGSNLTDDTTVSNIPADQIYTQDALLNTGEILQLFDPGNRLIDTANSNSGSWPAGSSTTFGSMERSRVVVDSDTAWFTNTGVVRNGLDANNNPINGTPKQANWATTVTATPSPLPTSSPRPTSTRTATPLPPPELVAINEFVPRPGRDWNNDGQVNTDDEFIELINHGTINVSLNGWTLDDEANIGSSPFVISSSIVLQPGERVVFYASDTGLLLSDGGDGVRLLKPNGGLIDAFNYTVASYPDQSFCRLPDNGGLDDWSRNCFPTPGFPNSQGRGSFQPTIGVGSADDVFCPVADTLPLDFFLAECDPFGHNIWSRFYWDDTGWYGEQELPNYPGKWFTFVD